VHPAERSFSSLYISILCWRDVRAQRSVRPNHRDRAVVFGAPCALHVALHLRFALVVVGVASRLRLSYNLTAV